ncbi:hypothetical protein N0V93_000030 [Gnomoniopsis smithogilvyi]|uniref:Cytochrome P450 n=1 Tax=Gnomoniopsis smithogilvyi TaxID=1191159 RepID=A0A9W8YYX9_9PEZI|nr:hypothetical protein N0V93_000030 [Gnomoniopsis smithogilvyi]
MGLSARIAAMREWQVIYYHLAFLLTSVGLVGYVIQSYGRYKAAKYRCHPSTGTHHGQVPKLDGSALYYGGGRWPVYDTRFNLRLSLLHGPVIRVEQGTRSFWTALLQQVDTSFLYLTGQPSRTDDTTILINSLTGDDGTLKRLLNSCASRAPSIATGKYLSRGRRIVLMPYGPEWLRHRKAFASLLTREKVRTLWAAALQVEAMVLVERLADVKDDGTLGGKRVVKEVSRFTASTVLQITYARRVATPDDPILKDLEVVSRNIASAFQPGRYWVENFAPLDIFPAFISPWKRKLNADHEFEASLFCRLLEDVEVRLGGISYEAQKGQDVETITPVEQCAAAQLLRGQARHGELDRDSIAYLAAGLFEAGTETTAMTINTFLLGTASNPEATRRAQAEMDELIALKCDGNGSKTMPGFEDLQGLPLLSAFVKEALRLTPAGASGVGHTFAGEGSQSFDLAHDKGEASLTKLDVPGGATVLANIYGLHHDCAMFLDPWRFNPSRWLSPAKTKEHVCRSTTLDYTHACFAFGFGKRICPGSTLACYSLTMAMALLLLCFDFSFTETAARLCVEMQNQDNKEYSAWQQLIGKEGRQVTERERTLKQGGQASREAKIGTVLVDAHVAFKLSREQVGECVHLVPREDGAGLAVVKNGLAALRSSSEIKG